MTETQASVCSNKECEVARTGNCSRGFDPIETCPEFTDEDVEQLDPGLEEKDDGPGETPETDDGVLLRPNGLITEEQITGFRQGNRTQTIVLVGEQRAGKTTLIAAVYGLFCKGPLNEYTFVSSCTLRAFAERNHLALKSSNLDTPTTPRTSRADPLGFFHLKLKKDGVISNIVISDRSGEAFEAARTNTALTDRLTELTLADRVCFLLDAPRLTKLETRAGYKRTFKQLVRTLLDNGTLPSNAKIEVLVTKQDRLTIKPDDRDLEAEVAAYEQELIEEFSVRGHDFSIHKVCALPRANVDLGFVGLGELIERWSSPATDVDITPPPAVGPVRWIDRLLDIWS